MVFKNGPSKICGRQHFSLVCFLSLKEKTCETWKNVYFTSEALFVLEKIEF